MHNCNAAVQDYHKNEAKLPEKPDRERLGGMKSRMEEKVQYHLGQKSPQFLEQGSYAMRTLIRTDDNSYDVDVGVAFAEANLLNDNGTVMTPSEAQNMMLKVAITIPNLKKVPEIFNGKCVRIYYADGPHIDVPVYRILKDGSYEIAANYTWKPSDPQAVTKWFKSEVSSYDDGAQVRYTVRLMKKWAKNCEDLSGGAYKMPSGFVITKLVCDAFRENGGTFERLDEAFYEIMGLIHNKLSADDGFKVYSPVIKDQIISNQIELINMKSRLGSDLATLKVLFDSSCNEEVAMKAWGNCFNNSEFFEIQLEKSLTASLSSPLIAATSPKRAVILGGDDRKG